MSRKIQISIAAIPLMLMAVLGFSGMSGNSVTVDEFAHLPAGIYYLETRDFSLYAKNPPLIRMITALPAIFYHPAIDPSLNGYQQNAWRPWVFGTRFMRLNPGIYLDMFRTARCTVLVMSLGLGLLVYLWSKKLYGPRAGLISLVCYCLCPNIMAHSMLATVDLGASLLIFAATFALLRFMDRPGFGRAGLAGLILGLAGLAKFTALLWAFLALALPLVIRPWLKWRAAEQVPRLRMGKFLTQMLILYLVLWLTLLSGYGWRGVFQPFNKIPLTTSRFGFWQRTLDGMPLPLPKDMIQGIDSQMRDAEAGEFSQYFLGEWHRSRQYLYYPAALLFKVPLPILLGFGFAVFAGRRKKESLLPDEAGLLTVIVAGFIFFGFVSGLQIGLRYLLPLFPPAYVLMGRLATVFPERKKARNAALVIGGICLLAANLYIYPHYLSYFNVLCGGPGNGHKILIDSNLDWGQDLPALKEFMERRGIKKINLAYFGHVDPALYGIDYDVPDKNSSGPVAISVNYLMGFRYPMLYRDPRGEIPPDVLAPYRNKTADALVGYSIRVFDLEKKP